MAGFEKYLRSDETVERFGAVSVVSLIAKALIFALVVFGYWLVTRLLVQLGSGSPLSEAMRPLQDLVFAALTAFLALYVAFQFAGLCLRAAFWRYALTGSRVLKQTFLRTRAADLAHVQDVEVIQNLLGKLLGYGNVVIRTASTDGTIVLRSVDKPYDWFREIHESVRTRQSA
jgi:membrane protein YdbS with pleckstrin-like domain